MKIIIDVNLSPEWSAILQDAGHEAVHWSEIGPREADDEEIVLRAERDGAVILTRDLDFGAYLVLAGRTPRASSKSERSGHHQPHTHAW